MPKFYPVVMLVHWWLDIYRPSLCNRGQYVQNQVLEKS